VNTWFNTDWYNDNWYNMEWFKSVSDVPPPDIGGNMAEQLRQGTGLIRTISATAPTHRVDGDPLDQTLITGYNFYMSYNAGPATLIGVTQLSNGVFTDDIDVDSQTPGIYDITYSTVTANFPNGGPQSPPLSLEILAPLAAPNPPTIS